MSGEPQTSPQPSQRFGAAELFGRAVAALPPKELRALAKQRNQTMACPFKPGQAAGHKKGGVCSLALFARQADGTAVVIGSPVTTCPSRFSEDGMVFAWVGEKLLGTSHPQIVGEVPFLLPTGQSSAGHSEAVGRIDQVLVHPQSNPFRWCAMETQAVYFSGGQFKPDLELMGNWPGPGVPFPTRRRRPDFRSSGPKRLMPQLQIKVPTLRRWGKKMAVVVDRAFREAMGAPRSVSEISNSDIAWFVVDYEGPRQSRYRLRRHEILLTTLESAVEGLTAGTPVSLERFESELQRKLARLGAS